MAAKTTARDTTAEIAFLTRALKAPTLRESVPRLAERARTESWTHEEFLAACLQREVAARESHGGEGRIRAARFPARKSLEEFDFDHARGLKREIIAHLGTLDFVTGRENVIFLGPPGTGKTHLAIGLAIRGCQAGHRVLFATAAQWVARLAEAHHAGRLQAELVRLGRYPLLVIDEVGYIPFEPEAANLFFQLVSARYERASLIVTSNKPFGKAHMFAATCARRRLKRGMFGNAGVEDRRWCEVVSADGDRETSGAVSADVPRRPSGSDFPALALFLLPPWEALACPVLSFP
jgi:DNA replication protein DnaC